MKTETTIVHLEDMGSFSFSEVFYNIPSKQARRNRTDRKNFEGRPAEVATLYQAHNTESGECQLLNEREFEQLKQDIADPEAKARRLFLRSSSSRGRFARMPLGITAAVLGSALSVPATRRSKR